MGKFIFVICLSTIANLSGIDVSAEVSSAPGVEAVKRPDSPTRDFDAAALRASNAAWASQADKHYPNEKLIDLGDHKLQVVSSGDTGPTVVFESGLGQSLESWLSIASKLNPFARSVCYSSRLLKNSTPA